MMDFSTATERAQVVLMFDGQPTVVGHWFAEARAFARDVLALGEALKERTQERDDWKFAWDAKCELQRQLCETLDVVEGRMEKLEVALQPLIARFEEEERNNPPGQRSSVLYVHRNAITDIRAALVEASGAHPSLVADCNRRNRPEGG